MKKFLRAISVSVLCLVLVQSGLLAADNLPVLWLEAGTEQKLSFVDSHQSRDWTLEAGHRVIARGSVLEVPHAQAVNLVQIAVKTPPLKPSVTLEATLLLGGVPVRKVILAAPSPFVDVDQWCKENPIALYDPEGKTAKVFEREEIAFTSLRSFAEIENSENAVLVIGAETNFDTEKGLADLLFAKAQSGGKILVLPPAEKISLAFCFASLESTESFVLQKKSNSLDIRFDSGRMIFDSQLQPSLWNSDVESRYYFKSLVETLSKNEEP
ncbi:MAG: hypothetical protein ACRC46_06965 [Thermoguttaceae bacterium]